MSEKEVSAGEGGSVPEKLVRVGKGDSVPVSELSAVERSFVSEKEVLCRRRKFCFGKGSSVSEK